MFINKLSVSYVSGLFTQEIVCMLNLINGFKTYTGEVKNADVIFIGVINSKAKRRDVFQRESEIFTEGELEESIGGRTQFYVFLSTKVTLNVQFYLIKDPIYFEKKLVKSEFGKYLTQYPKIIFNSNIGVSGTFTREIESTSDIDGVGIINFLCIKYVFEEVIEFMAKSAV